MKRHRRGLALIEIVVVIAIIAMLTSAVAVYAIAEYRRSRITVALTELKTLEHALDSYLTLTGRYPQTHEGFAPLLERQVLKEPPVDPWGTPFAYALVNGAPVITSYGADGEPGGDGDARDLVSSSPQGVRRQ